MALAAESLRKKKVVKLPFSHDAFLDVFAAYNAQLWPAVVLLWVATAGVAWRWALRGGVRGRLLYALLAVHWAWSGIAYHWFYFREINPAASLFAALFALQGVLFLWLASDSNAQAVAPAGLRGAVSGAFVLYGLVYPGVGLALGLAYPRLPLFAVPCPTALVTAGFIIADVGVPRFAAVIPILWAVVGSSAAVVLGISSDFALVVAAVLLALNFVVPSALGR